MNITQRITFAREHARLNTIELATKMEITPQAIQNWEYGKSAPRLTRLKKLAQVLDVSEEWLVTGAGSFKRGDPTSGDEKELDEKITHMIDQLEKDQKEDVIKLIQSMTEQRKILDKYGM